MTKISLIILIASSTIQSTMTMENPPAPIESIIIERTIDSQEKVLKGLRKIKLPLEADTSTVIDHPDERLLPMDSVSRPVERLKETVAPHEAALRGLREIKLPY